MLSSTILQSVENKLSPNEVRRRALHILPGFLPLALWGLPHSDPASPLLEVIVFAIVVVLSIVVYRHYHRIARNGNIRERMGASMGYVGSILATMLIFPAHFELSMTVLAVLAFGDGSATLGGLLLEGPALPWNKNKTWSGLICFLLFGTLAASVIYWGETHFNPKALGPSVPFAIALVCGGSAATAAAIVESLPLRINDNIRVGATAAIVVTLAHALTIGL